MIKINKLKMWGFPILFTLICAILISYFVTINQKIKYEYFTEQNKPNQPKSYISTEKVKLSGLLNYLFSETPENKKRIISESFVNRV